MARKHNAPGDCKATPKRHTMRKIITVAVSVVLAFIASNLLILSFVPTGDDAKASLQIYREVLQEAGIKESFGQETPKVMRTTTRRGVRIVARGTFSGKERESLRHAVEVVKSKHLDRKVWLEFESENGR